MQSFIELAIEKQSEVWMLFLEHIQLTFIAVSISIVIGVTLGILITKSKTWANIVIGIANVMQAIPTLAILGFLIPIVGIGSTPAIIMVIIYSMLPIIKNTYTALMTIHKETLEAAKAIGLTPQQILKRVKIPLAMPVIMAGIRIAAVTAVGLMTIAAFVGAGGLGYLVFSGIQTVNNNMILLGALPTAALALIIDYGIKLIEDQMTPEGIRVGNVNRKYRLKIVGGILSIILICTIGQMIYGVIKDRNTITVGSKLDTESTLLGHMVVYMLEEHTDLDIVPKLKLGNTQVLFEASRVGDVDIYIDYTGTMLNAILQEENVYETQQEVYEQVKKQYEKHYNQIVLPQVGINNTYAIAVRPDMVEEYGVKTISDLATIASELTVGTTIEFANRVDGLELLKDIYGLNFGEYTTVEGALRYIALNEGETDLTDAYSTDGLLNEFGLVLLEDDKEFFPPYYAVPVVSQEVLEEHPEIETCLNLLEGSITNDMIRELNYKVDVQKEDPGKIAYEFLEENSFFK